MRDFRNKISDETKDKTISELKTYIKKQLENSSTKPIGKKAA